MCGFHLIGPVALGILSDLEDKRVGACKSSFVTFENRNSGEIERSAWLRATDRPRRIDASLLTENYSENWDVRVQGAERTRQTRLLEQVRRRRMVR